MRALDVLLKNVEAPCLASTALATKTCTRALTWMAAAERVADGDLDEFIQSTSNDEVGQLLAALGRMNGSLGAS